MRKRWSRTAILIVALTACTSPSQDAADPSDAAPDGGGDVVDYVSTPVGLVHKSCVHEIADGELRPADAPCAYAIIGHTQQLAEPSRVIAANAPEAPLADNGWIEWGYAPLPSAGDFNGYFRVPSDPSHVVNQIVFFFPALEDPAGQNIIQPVLSFGPEYSSAANWQIASWYGGAYWGGNYYHSAPKQVYAGDTIWGDMAIDETQCTGGCLWRITTTDTSRSGSSTSLSVHTTLSWTNASATLEAYRINDCAQYPASPASFWNLHALDTSGRDVTPPTWQPSFAVAKTCGEAVTWHSPNAYLYYDGGQLASGATLSAGRQLASPDGRFHMRMQTDGNLVVYQGNTALWASHTNGKGGAKAIMQSDGNLVVYTSNGTPVWASGTSGHAGATLWMQSDGNAVIYKGGEVWASNACCH
jgi:hypothetical protein